MRLERIFRSLAQSPILLLAVICLPLWTFAFSPPCQADPGQPIAKLFQQWGEEALDADFRDFRLEKRGLYAEKFVVGQPLRDLAFMWGCGVQLSALAGAAQVEPRKYDAPLRAFADALQVYWTTYHNIGGYDVLPAPKPSDRYYDDNDWIVLALCETFEATHDAKYLDRAEATFRFVLSGEDDKLGGGIYWRENELKSKNTCSNGPAVTAALRLYQLTKKPEYLEKARSLYAWTRAHLQDVDGLFWDNVKLDGRVDKAKYSYNSALMIRANCLFYRITREPQYLLEAQRIAHAAEAKWVAPDTGALADGGRFAHLLSESFLAVHYLDHDPHWLKIVSDALLFLHNKVRDPMNRYADRWDKPASTALQEVALINQASAARAYWAAARAFR